MSQISSFQNMNQASPSINQSEVILGTPSHIDSKLKETIKRHYEVGSNTCDSSNADKGHYTGRNRVYEGENGHRIMNIHTQVDNNFSEKNDESEEEEINILQAIKQTKFGRPSIDNINEDSLNYSASHGVTAF